MTKPFDGEELLARLRVALRHRGGSEIAPKIYRKGTLEVDLDQRIARREGFEAYLTRKEHDVLTVLAANVGRVVTHQRILTAAWGQA